MIINPTQDISGKLDKTATAAAAAKLATARTILTNLGSTTAASFNGTANVTPGVTGVLPVANGGTGSSTEKYLPLAGGTLTGDLRIKGSGNYGTKINLGDGDYVHFAEPTDDCLEIKAKKINFVVSDTSDTNFTLNGTKIGGGGSSVSPATETPKAAGTAAVGTSDKYARGDHIHPLQTSVSGNAGTATALATARAIDGMNFNGSAAITHYGTCSTAAATAAKTVTKSGFTLVTGARIAVKFTAANTAANPTLNVNSTGAKPIYYGAGDNHVGRAGLWGAGWVVEFVYDGTNWILCNPSCVTGDSVATGSHSHSEGWGSATGDKSHAEGHSTASGNQSHAEGSGCVASGQQSHAEGMDCVASGQASHAHGYSNIAAKAYQTAIGKCNVESSASTDSLIIGKGSNKSSRANCFRVTHTGVYATGAHNTTGADYAELFEWADGNPDAEDRAGRFVTLDGEKIRLAGPEDAFILGIISGNPSVVGDVHDDQWQGMYLYDIFGRPLWEDVEVPDELGPDGEVIIPAHTEHRQKLNPGYDNSQPYQPRTQRSEWDAVGMLGKLVVVDDGTCEVNGWCVPGDGGVATRSEARTCYRVMARLDEQHVKVLVL